jgi:hypothetical protein
MTSGRLKELTNPIANRYEIDEKNAIIALQSILTTRGPVPEENYKRFQIYLSRLPPYRSILVYSHAMQAIASRMDERDPHRDALRTLGRTIAEHIAPDFPDLVEENPEEYEDRRILLAENINQIASFMRELADQEV